MSKKKRFSVSSALTQGMTDTVAIVENDDGRYRNTIIPLQRIELDPENPRKLSITEEELFSGINKSDEHYDKKTQELIKIKELAKSIKASGLLNPIVVFKYSEKYRIIAGARRFLANKLLEKNEIESRVYQSKPTDFEIRLMQWYENNEREDLTLYEKLENIRSIVSAYYNYQPIAVVKAALLEELLGLSNSQSSAIACVLNASKDISEAIKQSKINSIDKAAKLAQIKDANLRLQAIAACERGASLKELKEIVLNGKKALSTSNEEKNKKRGEKGKYISLGKTKNIKLIKVLLNAVVALPEYHVLGNSIGNIDWDNISDVQNAFSTLLKNLDSEIS